MESLLIFLLIGSVSITGYLAFLLVQTKKKIEEYNAITDIDIECAKRKKESEKLVLDAEKKENEAAQKVQAHLKTEKELQLRLTQLRKEVASLEEAEGLQSFGFYKKRYNFETSEHYRNQLNAIEEKQKSMIKDSGERKGAAYCETEWTVDGSKREGSKMTKNFLKLILRAFNGECDAAIAKVKYNNVNVQEARIQKAFESINKLAANNKCEITGMYLKLRLEELFLTHEFYETTKISHPNNSGCSFIYGPFPVHTERLT